MSETVTENARIDNVTVFPLELSTMPGFAGSSAYYLRYMDPRNGQALVSPEAAEYWKSVDLYIGGSEHATGHLIYSRFWNKFLFDLGKLQPVHYVGATFMHLPGPGVYVPRSMQVEVSADGKNYESIGTLWNDIDDKIPDLLFKTFSLTCNRQARYVRVHAVNGKEFIFVDEIIVN